MWKKIEEIGHRIGFTSNETVVILFLTVTLLGGGAAKIILSNSIGHRDFRQWYSEHDSLFRLQSGRAPSGALEPDTGKAMVEPSTGGDTRRSDLAPASININTATAAELERLPGIGPATAEKVIAYRQTVKKFSSIEEIMKVKSIGEKKFGRMKPYINVK
jgi:comEA protein